MGFINECLQRVVMRLRSGKESNKGGLTWTGTITKDTQITQCPFVVFDTELSGLDPVNDFIVSIGAVKMTGGIIHINKEFYRLIKPVGELTKRNIEIHGIMPEELKSQEDLELVLPEFLEFIRDSVLVGHFVHIDLKFLNRATKQLYGRRLINPAIDTHNLHEWLCENGREFRRHYRGVSNKTNLFAIAQRYGIAIESTHNALNDALMTALLFQRFIYFLCAEGINTLGELLDVGRA